MLNILEISQQECFLIANLTFPYIPYAQSPVFALLPHT